MFLPGRQEIDTTRHHARLDRRLERGPAPRIRATRSGTAHPEFVSLTRPRRDTGATDDRGDGHDRHDRRRRGRARATPARRCNGLESRRRPRRLARPRSRRTRARPNDARGAAELQPEGRDRHHRHDRHDRHDRQAAPSQEAVLLALLKAETLELKKSLASARGPAGAPAPAATGPGTGHRRRSVHRWRWQVGRRLSRQRGLRHCAAPGPRSSGSGAGGGTGGPRSCRRARRDVVVSVDLDATKQSEAKVGEPVTVEMPAGNTIDGKITVVSPIAQSSSGSAARARVRVGQRWQWRFERGSSATIPVTIALLDHHLPTTGLDQAAVSRQFPAAGGEPRAVGAGDGAAGDGRRRVRGAGGCVAAQADPGDAGAVRGRVRADLRVWDLSRPAGDRLAGLGIGVSADATGVALRLHEVSKEYPGGVHALRGVSVEIGDGEQVAVVGPSGSGKTTMLTILGTLERPTSGDVEVAGRDAVKASDGELAGSARARDRVRVPGVPPAGRDDRGRQRRDRDALHGGAGSASAARGARGARAGGARSSPDPQADAAVRRRAPAGRDRARAREARRRSSSPTSRRETSTRSPGEEVIELLHELASEGATLVLITHDENIAATFPRRLQMRDGEIVEDERVVSVRRVERRRVDGAGGAGAAAPVPRSDRDVARLPPHELLSVAVQGLRQRRLRAALSALGIAIGIGAMVAVVGVSASSQANLLATIDALGTNLLTVTRARRSSATTRCCRTRRRPMIEHMPNVNSAAAVYQLSSATVLRSPYVPREETGGIGVDAAEHEPAGGGRHHARGRPFHRRRERELPDGGARRAGGADARHHEPDRPHRGVPRRDLVHRRRDHETGDPRPDARQHRVHRVAGRRAAVPAQPNAV